MKITGNFIISILVGTVAGFLLGWVVYGILLDPFYASHCPHHHIIIRDMESTRLWGILVAQVCFAAMMTYVYSVANIRSVGKGFTFGAIMGGLSTAGTDFMLFSSTNMYTKEVYMVDIPVGAVFIGIIGAIIAFVLSKGK
ncbi:MAG: hypothetical protein JNM00_16495 [Flavobacteriales bacterium]|nr:hypothetical protein [Flavobacteriales bacterium]